MPKEEEYIYSNKEYNIYVNKNIENLFKIQIKNENSPLLSGLKKTKLIPGIIINNEYSEISFQANSIIPLKEYIKTTRFSYEKTQEFISSITIQLKYLQEQGYSFYGLDLESIIVINNSIFIQLSLEYLVPLNTNLISIYQPFSKKIFISPELYSQTTLPIFIPYYTINYSLAELGIFLLFKKRLQPKDNDNNTYKSILEPIEGTKLYWFLLRALEIKTLLYI